MSWNDRSRHFAGPSLKSGNYVRPIGTINGMQMDALKCYWVAIDLHRAVSIDRIGTYVSGGGGSGKLLRFMVYSDVAGVPSRLILDGGTVTANSTGPQEVTVSKALPLDRVWLAMVSDGTPTVAAQQTHGMVGNSDLTSVTNTANGCYIATLADLTAPDPAPTLSSGPNTAPMAAMRIV